MDSGANCDEILKDFASMCDEDIIQNAQEGNVAAWDFLLFKYKNFVRSKAKSYFLIGADKEDILQEGMLGLYKAIRDYRHGKSSFRLFAELCVRRQVITAIKTATRQKHFALNYSISLNRSICDGDRTLMDIIEEDESSDPEALMLVKEEFKGIKCKMQKLLSDFEWEVVSMYMEGINYQLISKKLKCSTKSIDNALQRAKRKLNWSGSSQSMQKNIG